MDDLRRRTVITAVLAASAGGVVGIALATPAAQRAVTAETVTVAPSPGLEEAVASAVEEALAVGGGAATSASSAIPEETEPPASDAVSKACADLQSALNVPVDSDRWLDRLLDAEDRAVSDAMYSQINDAYYASGNKSLGMVEDIITEYC